MTGEVDGRTSKGLSVVYKVHTFSYWSIICMEYSEVCGFCRCPFIIQVYK